MPDTGAVPFAFVPSGTVHFRKALLVSSLKELHATLDQYGVERNQRRSPAPERRPEQMTAGKPQVGNGAELEIPDPSPEPK